MLNVIGNPSRHRSAIRHQLRHYANIYDAVFGIEMVFEFGSMLQRDRRSPVCSIVNITSHECHMAYSVGAP